VEAIGMRDRDIEFSVLSGTDEETLLGCLQSLRKTMKQSRYSWSVTVTCNPIAEGLPRRLRTGFPGVAVIENATPRGFAECHNRVLRVSRARYVWLLDGDLLILPDAVLFVTEFLERPENSRVGIAGPQLLNPDGSIQPAVYGFPSMQRTLFANMGWRGRRPRHVLPEGNVDVDTLPEACLAIRTTAYRHAGPIDSLVSKGPAVMGWHRRFREQGWKVARFSNASVIHYGAHTVPSGSGAADPDRLESDLSFFRSCRQPAIFSMFCAALAVTFAGRSAIALARRRASPAAAAWSCARLAFDSMLGRERTRSPIHGARGEPDLQGTSAPSF